MYKTLLECLKLTRVKVNLVAGFVEGRGEVERYVVYLDDGALINFSNTGYGHKDAIGTAHRLQTLLDRG